MNAPGSSSWHADLEQPGVEPPTFQLVDVLLDLLNHSHSKLTAPGIPRRCIRVLTGPDPCSVSEIRCAQGGRIVILLEQGPGFRSNSFSVWSLDVPLRAWGRSFQVIRLLFPKRQACFCHWADKTSHLLVKISTHPEVWLIKSTFCNNNLKFSLISTFSNNFLFVGETRPWIE